MRENAEIEVETQADFQGEVERCRFVVPARWTWSETGFSLSYTEPTEDEPGAQVTVTGSPAALCLARKGACTSVMRFARGQAYPCRYQTPYGDLSLTVVTDNVDHRLSAQGGTLFLSYRLHTTVEDGSRHMVKITVRVLAGEER